MDTTTPVTHDAVTDLPSGLVVDKLKLNKLGAVDLSVLLSDLYSVGKPVVIIDNVGTFFTSKNLLSSLEAGDAGWKLIAEKFNIEISTHDLHIINSAIHIRKRIIEAAGAIGPSYPFADVPNGWSYEDDIQITANYRVQRERKNSHGDGCEYYIGIKTLANVWAKASKLWSDVEKSVSSHYIEASGYTRQATYYDNQVVIGCQTIRRYELEQVALKRGWKFPE